jgi:hypothetical protein
MSAEGEFPAFLNRYIFYDSLAKMHCGKFSEILFFDFSGPSTFLHIIMVCVVMSMLYTMLAA